VTSGTPPYTFTYTGTLPPGLTLSPAGVLSGVPTASGVYTFTVVITDSGTPTQTASKSFGLEIGSASENDDPPGDDPPGDDPPGDSDPPNPGSAVLPDTGADSRDSGLGFGWWPLAAVIASLLLPIPYEIVLKRGRSS